jgi:3-hydroxyisobutyrate dehydrogenase-like beta-hydroxyacid dehydrogenase
MNGTVGVIGLGIMGGAMARNLRQAGWTVVGYDVSKSREAEAEKAGIQIAQSAGELADQASDIITSLPNPKAVIATAEAIAGCRAGQRTVIETSTLAIEDKLKFAEILNGAGHIALDCPLSGTGAQAAAKDLVIYASGDHVAIKRLEPLFLGFGRRVFDLGAFGNGSRMKFVANHLVAIHNVASAEAMVLGMKAGLDPRQIVEVIGAGAGASRIFDLRAPMMAANRYEPATMRCATWKKDMDVIGAFASSLACPVPVFHATQAIYDANLAMGNGALDTASVCAVLESMAGVHRQPKSGS